MHEITTGPEQATQSPFESIRRFREDGSEFWSARELMGLLGYEKWERFEGVLDRAKISADAQGDWLPGAGNPIREVQEGHFRDASIETTSGKGKLQLAADVHLSRFAAYLVAMNGDPRKPEIAAAQRYFAIRTRQAETSQQMVLDLFPGGPDSMRELGDLLIQLAGLREGVHRVETRIAAVCAGDPPDLSSLGTTRGIAERVLAFVAGKDRTSVTEVLAKALPGVTRTRGVEMAISRALVLSGMHRVQALRGGARIWEYARA